VSDTLLAAFGVAGGAPPATLESLRVHADGRVRAIVGAAWPAGQRQDEAGLYETTLAPDERAALAKLAGDGELRALAGEHGPLHADSGRSSLSLAAPGGAAVEIAWGAFATPPEPLPAAVAALRGILARVREHPVAVVRLGLEHEGDALAFTLANPGRERVRHSLLLAGTEPLRVAAVSADPPPPAAYRAGVPATLLDAPLDDDVLEPGAARRLRASTAVTPAAGERLVAFARGTVELAVDGEPLALDAFLVAHQA
jgi:hypothetical protein